MDAKRKMPCVVMNCEKLAGEFAVAALSAAVAFAAAAARAGEVFERAAVAAVKAAERDGFERVRGDNAAWWRRFWEEGARASFDSEPEMKDGRVVDFKLGGAKKGDEVRVTCPTDPSFRSVALNEPK